MVSSGLQAQYSVFGHAGEGEREALLQQALMSERMIPANPKHPLRMGCCGSFKNNGHLSVMKTSLVLHLFFFFFLMYIFSPKSKMVLYTEMTQLSPFFQNQACPSANASHSQPQGRVFGQF